MQISYYIKKNNPLNQYIPKFMNIRQLFHVKNVCKNVINQQVEMDVWTFWSQLSSCCAFHIVSNCIRNHRCFKSIEQFKHA